jgi:hypothetical protein
VLHCRELTKDMEIGGYKLPKVMHEALISIAISINTPEAFTERFSLGSRRSWFERHRTGMRGLITDQIVHSFHAV